MTDSEPHVRIVFDPFSEKENSLFDACLGAVLARLTLYFVDDDGSLKLAEKLISSFRNGKGDAIEVEGSLTIYHDDDELPPTPFENVAPDWLAQIIDTYRKDGSPALLKELRRLEGLVEAVSSHEPDSHFDEEQNDARRDARVAQDVTLGSRELMRERLDAAVNALKHYAQGDDSARARAVLAFLDVDVEEEGT